MNRPVDSKVLLAVLSAMLCMACAGIVAMDDEVDAVGDPLGSYGNPIVLSSNDLLDVNLADFYGLYYDYLIDNYECYFEIDYGSEVIIHIDLADFYDIVLLSLPVSMDYFDSDYNDNIISGTITDDLVILIEDGGEIDCQVYIHPAVSVDFTSPDAIDAFSNSTISYRATTNIYSTFAEVGGSAASWLDINPFTGQVTGTLPTVDSETTFTYEIQATSDYNQSNTATLTLTITVIPTLEFLSNPISDGTVSFDDTPVMVDVSLMFSDGESNYITLGRDAEERDGTYVIEDFSFSSMSTELDGEWNIGWRMVETGYTYSMEGTFDLVLPATIVHFEPVFPSNGIEVYGSEGGMPHAV